MVSNPVWRQTTSDFGQMTRQWLLIPTPDTLMSLAIFIDAHAVCGDATLLEGVRLGVFNLVTDNDAMLARFASAINSFAESGGWWNRLLSLGEQDEDELDLKKAGIFPLVHGIRSMALEKRLSELGTAARIQRLVAAGKLTAEMGADLTDSLHFFMGLKLKTGLADVAMNRPASNAIRMSTLSSLDRDLLKDTLGVVKRFKALMRQRFHLDMVSS
jgi:CBS domain-containing protein